MAGARRTAHRQRSRGPDLPQPGDVRAARDDPCRAADPGDADLYAPTAGHGMFAARVQGSQAVVVPEAGHSAYWEQPEVFNRTGLDFSRETLDHVAQSCDGGPR